MQDRNDQYFEFTIVHAEGTEPWKSNGIFNDIYRVGALGVGRGKVRYGRGVELQIKAGERIGPK